MGLSATSTRLSPFIPGHPGGRRAASEVQVRPGIGTTAPGSSPSAGPPTIRFAAVMFLLHGTLVLLNGFAFSSPAGSGIAGWEDNWDFPRMLVHPLAAGLVALGLLHQARWARWAGLGLALGWLATGGLAMLVLEHHDLHWLPPSEYQFFAVGALLSLGAAVALLLSPGAPAGLRAPDCRGRTPTPGRGAGEPFVRADAGACVGWSERSRHNA